MKIKFTHAIVLTLFAGIILFGRPLQAGFTAGPLPTGQKRAMNI